MGIWVLIDGRGLCLYLNMSSRIGHWTQAQPLIDSPKIMTFFMMFHVCELNLTFFSLAIYLKLRRVKLKVSILLTEMPKVFKPILVIGV